MAADKLKQAIATALESRPERKFTETVEVAINLKDVDLNNPTKRIKDEVTLPHGRGRPARVGVFAKGEMAVVARDHADLVITPEELDELAGDKRAARKLADRYDFFVADATLMATIGRTLGIVLGPRGKMPRPVPPAGDIVRAVSGLRNLVNLRSKDRPTFHIPIGNDRMEIDQLVENLDVVLRRVISHLERGDQNIASVWIKTSMGKAVRL